MRAMGTTIELDDHQVHLLREALDSHLYWQVSDEQFRDSGYVFAPVSDDPEKRAEALEVDRLLAVLGESYFDDDEQAEIARGGRAHEVGCDMGVDCSCEPENP